MLIFIMFIFTAWFSFNLIFYSYSWFISVFPFRFILRRSYSIYYLMVSSIFKAACLWHCSNNQLLGSRYSVMNQHMTFAKILSSIRDQILLYNYRTFILYLKENSSIFTLIYYSSFLLIFSKNLSQNSCSFFSHSRPKAPHLENLSVNFFWF